MDKDTEPSANRLRLPAALAAGAAALILASAGAPAEEPLLPGFGHLTALSSGAPPPAGTVIAVRPDANDFTYGGDPFYAVAREQVRKALLARGYRLDGDGALVLSFRLSLPAGSGRPRPGAGRTPKLVAPTLERQVQIVQPQFGGAFEQTPPAVPRYALALSLFRHGQVPTWRATISAAGATGRPRELLAKMTAAVMKAFGESAERDFAVFCKGPGAEPGGICLE